MTTADIQTMCALAAKDWRLFRVPVFALLIVSGGTYLLALIGALEPPDGWAQHYRAMYAMNELVLGSLAALALTSLLAAAFGGMAVARERRERTSDFLALLPVTRGQIVFSKLLVSALVLCACAVFHEIVILALCLFQSGQLLSSWATFALISSVVWLGFTVCFFGLGWQFSTFSTSGAISSSAAIAVTLVSAALVANFVDPHIRLDREAKLILAAVAFSIGIASTIAGVVYYLRRIAP